MAESTARTNGNGKRTRRRAPGAGSVFQVRSSPHAGTWRVTLVGDAAGGKVRKYLEVVAMSPGRGRRKVWEPPEYVTGAGRDELATGATEVAAVDALVALLAARVGGP